MGIGGDGVRGNYVWVVDRIEGAVAVMVRDGDERREDVSLALLSGSEGIAEGTVLRVPEADGRPVWSEAVADEEARQARLREAEEVLQRLRRRDPGGDVVL